MRFRTVILIALFCVSAGAVAQPLGVLDEEYLHTMNKQVSQFFSRFNCEENPMGVKYLPTDTNYRNQTMRRNVLQLMFDNTNTLFTPRLREMFIEDMTSSPSNFFEFGGGRWYAEVNAEFVQGKEPIDFVFDLVIEQAQWGYKWVIAKVHCDEYDRMYNKDVSDRARMRMILHPMSHEVDFMTMRNAFANTDYIQLYAKQDHEPDYLSLFMQDIKRGTIKFKYVKNVKIHVFQLKDWYFEISNFIRTDNNSGWLISNLMYIPEADKQAIISFYE